MRLFSSTSLLIKSLQVACIGASLSSCGLIVFPGPDYTLKPDPAQLASFAWVAQYGDGAGDSGNAVTTDADGNVIMTGYTASYQSDPERFTALWQNEIITAKYTSDGQQVWVRRTAKNRLDSCAGMAVATDANGNVYVAGYFTDTVNFHGVRLVSAGSSDAFLAKYTPDGQFLWVRRFGGRNAETVRGMAVDASGRIYVVGYFNGSSPRYPAETADGFLIQFNADGEQQWAQNLASSEGDVISSVAIAPSGEVYCAGYFSGQAMLGTALLQSMNPKSSITSAFLAKFSPSGQILWTRNTEGSYASFQAIATDNQGNICLTGDFSGTVRLGGRELTSTQSSDILTAKYSSGGELLWAKSVGGIHPTDKKADGRSESGESIATDASGNIYVTGLFSYVAQFGSIGLVERHYQSPFIAKYDAQGTVLWAKAGDYQGQPRTAITSTPDGTIYLTGAFRGTTLFGANSLTSDDGDDIFLGRLLP